MVSTDAVEGTIGEGPEALWFHYDLTADTLYLRLAAHRTAETAAEETADGFLLLRRTDDDTPVGLTVVNWWKRHGKGDLPDSLRRLEEAIEPWAQRLAA